jgi:hypothetical protein
MPRGRQEEGLTRGQEVVRSGLVVGGRPPRAAKDDHGELWLDGELEVWLRGDQPGALGGTVGLGALAAKHSVGTTDTQQDGSSVPKKPATINDELTMAGAYSQVGWQQVTTWTAASR